MPETRHVELIMDFVCVHCYIGFTRLRRAADSYRASGGAVDIQLRPFQLRPDTSSEGEPLFDVHTRERGEDFAKQVAADRTIGSADGLRLDFRRAVFTNTAEAHRLVARAARQGRGEAMAERLFRAYFSDGLNISDAHTLTELANEIGVAGVRPHRGPEPDEFHNELDRVRQLGITETPVFRFDNGTILVGEHQEHELLHTLARARLSPSEDGPDTR